MNSNTNSHPLAENGENLNATLVEYQKTQDSAQHHDSLTWSITSILWGANLVLLGFVLNNVLDEKLRVLLSVLSVLGLLVTVFVYKVYSLLNSVVLEKYNRCKELEDPLGFKQHSTLSYPKGRFKPFLILLMLLFILAWVFVLFTVWQPVLSHAA